MSKENKTVEEFLKEWEKVNNPFYPKEMQWRHGTIISVLEAYAQSNPKLSPEIGLPIIRWTPPTDKEIEKMFPIKKVNRDIRIVQENQDNYRRREGAKTLRDTLPPPSKEREKEKKDCKHEWEFVPIVGHEYCPKCKEWNDVCD